MGISTYIKWIIENNNLKLKFILFPNKVAFILPNEVTDTAENTKWTIVIVRDLHPNFDYF